MEIKLSDFFPEKKYGVISSFVCEGGMIGKQPLRIAHTVYPEGWDGWGGAKDADKEKKEDGK